MQLELVTQKPGSNTHPTPILFVHGAWNAAWCWEEYFLPYFAQNGYVSHALSLRGHGASEGRERLRFASIADYVADVAQVVESLEPAPILVGHSMGGLIVQKYLESHRAPAAVLLASVPTRGVIVTTLRVARRHPLAFLKANLTLNLYPIIETPSLARDALFSADMPDEKIDAYHRRLQTESYRAYLDMMIFALPRPRRVTTPMLVLGAGTDALFSRGEIEATARAYDAPFEIFPGTAHQMMLEDGWQSVADRILGWLKETVPSSR